MHPCLSIHTEIVEREGENGRKEGRKERRKEGKKEKEEKKNRDREIG